MTLTSLVIWSEFLGKRCLLALLWLTFVMSSLNSLNPTNEEVEELKNDIDEDGDGEIDFDEFLKIMNSTKLRYR